jgi:hypothetical protein
MAIKHVGRYTANQRKVIVAYRTVPGEHENCIIVPTESLSDDEHDALIRCVESSAGQEAYEFAEAMARYTLPDGRNMLAAFHTTRKMQKVSTADVEMTPDNKTTILLSELNKIIAEQKGVTVADLALHDDSANKKAATVEDVATVTETPAPAEPVTLEAPADGVISDEELAAKYRSDADRLFKEAKALREQAEALVPTKKTKTKESA